MVKNEAYDDFCHPSTAESFKSHTQLVILAPLFLCTRKRQKNKLHTWLPTFSSSFYTWDLMALYPETLSYSLTTNFLLLHGANWGDWSVSHVAKYKKKNAQNRKGQLKLILPLAGNPFLLLDNKLSPPLCSQMVRRHHWPL